MNREKMAWLVSVLLIAMLAFNVPRSSMAQRESDYKFVRRLVDIHRHISQHYVEDVNDEKLQNGALDGMFNQLDPFSMYVPPAKQQEFDRMLEGTFEGVGIQLNLNEQTKEIEIVTPIEGSPAFKAGVLAGDVILKVNGENVTGLPLKDVTAKIKGKVGTSVTLRVRHTTGEEAELTMNREEIVMSPVKGFKRRADNEWDWYVSPDPKIGYIRITQFTPDTAEKVKDALQGSGKWKGMLNDGMKGLILDLRFNPGGRLDQAVQLVDLFIEKGTIVYTEGRARPKNVITATAAGTLPYFPMIVLINEHSASASEIVAGSLKDNGRALLIGERTYGKGSVQELINLDSNQGELKLTVAYYYLPKGRLVHRKKDASDWGVNPDLVVEVDEATERKVMMELETHDRFLPPVSRNSTKPTTRPATQPVSVDVQLQRAVEQMVGGLVMSRTATDAAPAPTPGGTSRPASAVPPVPDTINPTSKPATAPTTRPAK